MKDKNLVKIFNVKKICHLFITNKASYNSSSSQIE